MNQYGKHCFQFIMCNVLICVFIGRGPVDQSTPIARKRLRTEQTEEEL